MSPWARSRAGVDDERVNTTASSGPATNDASASFPCPQCGVVIATGSPACASCGIRLTGPLAVRLWRMDRDLAALMHERAVLCRRLLAPPDADEREQTRAWVLQHQQSAPAGSAPHTDVGDGVGTLSPYAGRPARAAGPSGQQVLLGLGALLLLSGVAFFLAVVWFVVGLIGQAVIMVVLTGLAAGGAVLATRKRLDAAAETAAVIASGFVVLDLTAAYGKGLAGLDRFTLSEYWSVAGWVGALLLIGFDRLVPSTVRGTPARTLFTYWPVAAVLATVALGNLGSVLAPDDLGPVGVSVACVLMALAFGALALAVSRLDVRSSRYGRLTWAVVPPLAAALTAALAHQVAALVAAYGVNPAGERYTAMVLLLVLPALLAAARVLLRGHHVLSTTVLVWAGLGVCAALGVPLMDMPRIVVALLAVPVALALGVTAWRGAGRGTAAYEWVGRGVLGILYAHGMLLELTGAETGTALRAGDTGTDPSAWWVPALPALLLAGVSAVSAVRHYAPLPTLLTHVAGATALVTAVRDAEPMTWTVLWLVAGTVSVVVAGVVHAMHHESTEEPEFVRDDAARRRGADTGTLELVNLVGGAVYGFLAVVAAMEVGPQVTGTTLLLVGAVLLAYAVLPGRLGVAYLGTAAVGLGNGVLLDHADVEVVEGYTLPVVVLLAVIGAVQERRHPRVRTFLSMGPALGVGLLPSLAVAMEEGGDVARLLLVTVTAMLVLVVGLWRRWQAPVALGALVLAVVAVNQGGPLVAELPTFVLLVAAGAVLLALGVAFEHAVNTGRRGAAWFRSLR